MIGCTSRTWRQNLEAIGQVHLCRIPGCAAAHHTHVDQYAAIDHVQSVDLAEYGAATPGRPTCAGIRRVLRALWWMTFGLGWSAVKWAFWPRPEPRYISDATGHRILAPDSESEAEVEDRP